MTARHPKLIDLTLPAPLAQGGRPTYALEERHLTANDVAFTGMVYHFQHDSMVGTYIDFPGHIKETDDGQDSVGYPVERLYRVEAVVVHLARASGSGGIGADELAAACPPITSAGALIVNALGRRRFDEIDDRSVYLSAEAVRWVIDSGFHLLISDVYESKSLHGVFGDLFAHGVSTVCCPINLHLIDRPRVRLTALPARFPSVTQLPCRVIVETE